MYVEERMYLLHPGKVPEYFRLYESKIRPLIVTQDTRVMKPAPFFKERFAKMLAAAK